MLVSNVKYYENLDFAKYLTMPGVSYSSLKEGVTYSSGMSLGTKVHNYILEPHKYEYGEDHKIVAEISQELLKIIDISLFEKELSVTADFEHEGFALPFKGRIDLGLRNKIVIDFKILQGSLESSINYFGYDKQLSGYCYACGADNAVIISYNKSKKCTEVKLIKPNPNFWEQEILKRGKVL